MSLHDIGFHPTNNAGVLFVIAQLQLVSGCGAYSRSWAGLFLGARPRAIACADRTQTSPATSTMISCQDRHLTIASERGR